MGLWRGGNVARVLARRHIAADMSASRITGLGTLPAQDYTILRVYPWPSH
jgi:hypothetical protein